MVPAHLRRVCIIDGHFNPDVQNHPPSSLEIQGSETNSIPSNNTVLVGSIIMDVLATPAANQSLYQGGSVIGHIEFAPGGVARNIAHTLALLSKSSHRPVPTLISAVGHDAAGNALLQNCKELGIDTSTIMKIHNGRTPTVSIIFNSRDGDVAASVADVELLEKSLTREMIQSMKHKLLSAKVIVVDGDLSFDTLHEVCTVAKSSTNTHSTKPLIWFEPVSISKSLRGIPLLSSLDFISPNIDELKSMARSLMREHATPLPSIPSNISSQSIQLPLELLRSVKKELHAVLDAGVQNIVLTMGPLGAALCTFSTSREHRRKGEIIVHHAPASKAKIVNCSGAGDCLVAGFTYALVSGYSPQLALKFGVVAAKEAVESETNVPGNISWMHLMHCAENVVIETFYI